MMADRDSARGTKLGWTGVLAISLFLAASFALRTGKVVIGGATLPQALAVGLFWAVVFAALKMTEQLLGVSNDVARRLTKSVRHALPGTERNAKATTKKAAAKKASAKKATAKRS